MAKVKAISFLGKQDVYNMEVKTHHNFSVNGGLIVHNCGYGLVTWHSRKSKPPKSDKGKIAAHKDKLAKQRVGHLHKRMLG